MAFYTGFQLMGLLVLLTTVYNPTNAGLIAPVAERQVSVSEPGTPATPQDHVSTNQSVFTLTLSMDTERRIQCNSKDYKVFKDVRSIEISTTGLGQDVTPCTCYLLPDTYGSLTIEGASNENQQHCQKYSTCTKPPQLFPAGLEYQIIIQKDRLKVTDIEGNYFSVVQPTSRRIQLTSRYATLRCKKGDTDPIRGDKHAGPVTPTGGECDHDKSHFLVIGVTLAGSIILNLTIIIMVVIILKKNRQTHSRTPGSVKEYMRRRTHGGSRMNYGIATRMSYEIPAGAYSHREEHYTPLTSPPDNQPTQEPASNGTHSQEPVSNGTNSNTVSCDIEYDNNEVGGNDLNLNNNSKHIVGGLVDGEHLRGKNNINFSNLQFMKEPEGNTTSQAKESAAMPQHGSKTALNIPAQSDLYTIQEEQTPSPLATLTTNNNNNHRQQSHPLSNYTVNNNINKTTAAVTEGTDSKEKYRRSSSSYDYILDDENEEEETNCSNGVDIVRRNSSHKYIEVT